jgi:hypothetical protein
VACRLNAASAVALQHPRSTCRTMELGAMLDVCKRASMSCREIACAWRVFDIATCEPCEEATDAIGRKLRLAAVQGIARAAHRSTTMNIVSSLHLNKIRIKSSL